jgi:hypothetical protein
MLIMDTVDMGMDMDIDIIDIITDMDIITDEGVHRHQEAAEIQFPLHKQVNIKKS